MFLKPVQAVCSILISWIGNGFDLLLLACQNIESFKNIQTLYFQSVSLT